MRRGARPPRAPAARQSRDRDAAPPDPNLVLLGEFGRPHGLNGEVRLKSHTGEPMAIAGYGPLATSDGRTLVLTDARPAAGASPDLLVVRVRDVRDRGGAEALNGVRLYCLRERLGAPEDEDEFFTADLIGLDAVDAAGTVLGTIVAVPNYGGGDLLEIRPALGGATALLPFTKAFVPEIDTAKRRVVLAAPDDLFAAPGPKPVDEPT